MSLILVLFHVFFLNRCSKSLSCSTRITFYIKYSELYRYIAGNFFLNIYSYLWVHPVNLDKSNVILKNNSSWNIGQFDRVQYQIKSN